MWRQEIADNTSAPLMTTGKMFNESANSRLYMGRTYKHPDLYEAYPELKTLGVKVEKGNDAAFYPKSYEVKYGVQNPKGADIVKPDVTAHELQHAIQGSEGWARGGGALFGTEKLENAASSAKNALRELSSSNGFYKAAEERAARTGEPLGDLVMQPDWFYKSRPINEQGLFDAYKKAKEKAAMSAHDQYLRLAGEAEARATQARMPLNAAQRRAMFPLDSYDVPLDQLIIRK